MENKLGNPIIVKDENTISIKYDDRCIIISTKHEIYLNDIVYDFNSYFNAVEYEEINGTKTIDFSTPKSHITRGFEDFAIMYSSFPEPIGITDQYSEFAQLDENSIVLDLGAYAGLTSILFDKELSKNNSAAKGKVIAIDADTKNIPCINTNFKNYKAKTGRTIEYLHAAAAGKDGTIEFSCEGNMGASTVNIVGNKRGPVEKVRAISLSSIAKEFNLKKIDFIKCDIEGGEIDVFKDWKFFMKHNPRIIVETHFLNANRESSLPIVKKYLKGYNYTFKEYAQNDTLYSPILECYPDVNKNNIVLNYFNYVLNNSKNTVSNTIKKLIKIKNIFEMTRI